jgi:hypothetical protein
VTDRADSVTAATRAAFAAMPREIVLRHVGQPPDGPTCGPGPFLTPDGVVVGARSWCVAARSAG